MSLADGLCYFCEKSALEESMCHGCGEYVHDTPECSPNDDMPFGGHDVELHAQEEEDFDDC